MGSGEVVGWLGGWLAGWLARLVGGGAGVGASHDFLFLFLFFFFRVLLFFVVYFGGFLPFSEETEFPTFSLLWVWLRRSAQFAPPRPDPGGGEVGMRHRRKQN